MKVNIKLLRENAVIPTKAHNTDNGYDLIACAMEYKADIDCWVYYTGIAIEVPNGYSLDIIPRSSVRKTDYYMPNTPGDVDPGYTGEIQVSYKNRTNDTVIDCINIVAKDNGYIEPFRYNNSNPPYKIGDRIAQCYLTPHPDMEFNKVDELQETERGANGHGSTGK